MIHRHLDLPPATPVEELPSAALVDLLERGDLGDWRPIVLAVARDPFGPFADRVRELIDHFPMYGVSALLRAWIDHRRAREEGRRIRAPETTLANLRRQSGLTQVEFARRLGMSQSDLSKLERRTDLRLSTLRKYAKALGGSLHIVFERNGDRLELSIRQGRKRR